MASEESVDVSSALKALSKLEGDQAEKVSNVFGDRGMMPEV